MTPAEMVANYIKLRDHKREAEREFKDSMEKVNLAMETLETRILKYLQDNGAESISTELGTAYIRPFTSATVFDREEFRSFVQSTGNFDLIDLKANKTAVKDLLDAGELVPGVKYTETAAIGVRRK